MTTHSSDTHDQPGQAVRALGRAGSNDANLHTLEARVEELEARLRERLEENHVLHDEVRCLFLERQVRNEYITSLETAATRLPAAERQLFDTDDALKDVQASFDAYRCEAERRMGELDAVIGDHQSRRVVVVTNKLATTVRRYPAAAALARTVKRSVRPRPLP